MLKISTVFIYDEPSVPEIEINNLARFIQDSLTLQVVVRKNFFEHFKSDKKIAHKLASSRIFNPFSSFERHHPTEEEINLEEESFTDKSVPSNIILYDGFEIQKLLGEIIPEEESSLDKFHLIFTTRLTCTYDYEDYRYHGRAVICSNPSIISTTGIIEAPAKPRDYYINMYYSMFQGLNLDSLKDQFRGRFLDYHDSNLGKVIKGYVLQAIFYHLTGEPFCDSKDCILYNSHWQEDLIHSQLELGKLCNTHQKILESTRNNK